MLLNTVPFKIAPTCNNMIPLSLPSLPAYRIQFWRSLGFYIVAFFIVFPLLIQTDFVLNQLSILGTRKRVLERDQSCRVGLKPFCRWCCMRLLDREYHVHGSIVMMKKPAVSCQRLGHLFYTTSHEWCRMGSWNSWFAISSLGTNS